jgi:hypothetical protein
LSHLLPDTSCKRQYLAFSRLESDEPLVSHIYSIKDKCWKMFLMHIPNCQNKATWTVTLTNFSHQEPTLTHFVNWKKSLDCRLCTTKKLCWDSMPLTTLYQIPPQQEFCDTLTKGQCTLLASGDKLCTVKIMDN